MKFSDFLELSKLAKSMGVPMHKLLALGIDQHLFPTSKGDYLIHWIVANVVADKFSKSIKD